MAGALSGHILNSYESSVSNQSICTDGLISFNPNMHGSFNPNMHSTQQSFSFDNPSHASMSTSESAYDRVSRLQTKLNQKLGPEFISQRPGPGGGPKLTYAEGWKVINVANEVFGFEGWSSNIVSLTTDYMDYNEESRRYNVGVSAVMRVTLKEGVFHEDVGYGMIENAKAKGAALDKCKKEAVTDGLKRTLRTFGNVLGNCLYDKQYTAEIVKIKVPPVKLDKGDLHRLPDFYDRPPASASTSRPTNATSTPVRAPAPAPAPAAQQQKWQPQQQATKPISSVPRHMQPSGLHTPITTPTPAPGDRKVSFAPTVNAEPAPQWTKPLQQQRQSAQMPPPPPPIPAPASAMPPALDDDTGDDSFGCFSDDDAFLACVDMGEGDLGQPIDFEEGTGASAVSAASTVTDEEKETERRPEAQPVAARREQERHGPMGLSRPGGARPATAATSSTSSRAPPARGMPFNAASHSNPPQANPAHAQAPAAARGGPSNSAFHPNPPHANQTHTQAPAVAQAAPSNPTSYANAPQHAQNPKPPSGGPAAAPAPAASTSGSGSTGASAAPPPTTRRPSTPSIGGFHFPPGMANPLLQNHNPSRPPPPAPQGVKRGADAMMGGPTRSVNSNGTSAGGGGRQPLGTLALGGQPQQPQQQYQLGGSDMKRIKR